MISFDLGITQRGLLRGAKETNPLLAPVFEMVGYQNIVLLVPLILAFHFLIIKSAGRLAEKLEKGKNLKGDNLMAVLYLCILTSFFLMQFTDFILGGDLVNIWAYQNGHIIGLFPLTVYVLLVEYGLRKRE